MRSIGYLTASGRKLICRQGLSCPSCGTVKSNIVDRKYLVTFLRRCSNCKLLFRAPTTTERENAKLYAQEYEEAFTTDLPKPEELREMLSRGFRDSERDYTAYVEVLKALGAGPGTTIYDFGCSWGYGSWQLAQAGFQVDSFDICAPRAEYGVKNLGIRLVPPESVRSGSYDIFFSAHVIEHVPSVSRMISFGLKCLRRQGLFVAFTPNACAERRAKDPRSFHSMWGFVHPQLIDWEFLSGPHVPEPVIADSSPYSIRELSSLSWTGRQALKLAGPELLIVMKNAP